MGHTVQLKIDSDFGKCNIAFVPTERITLGELKMKLLVLDGNSILNRAFYGIKILTTKDGQFTNGIYGFLMMLQKLKDQTAPDAVAIAFDMRAPTFRHKEYAQYKAQRKGMPEELAHGVAVQLVGK